MIEWIAIGGGALAAGSAAGYLFGSSRARANVAAVEEDARRKALEHEKEVEDRARKQADELLENARTEAERVRTEAEHKAKTDLQSRRGELEKLETRLARREEKLDERAVSLDEKQSELTKEERELQRLNQSVTDRTSNLKQKEEEISSRLEEVANLSREEAKKRLIEEAEEQARLDVAKRAREIEEQTLAEADKKAKKVLATTIQRYAGEYVTERCVSVVNLPSDDMKGRIIGREGRNIRAFEAATGCDLIIDDTPEAVVVSCFDPVRRQLGRQSLERLIADGRIHPSRIEETVEKTNSEMERTIKEAGEQASFELGLSDIHPEVEQMVGRLKYRTSYGQNIWSHSIEVGFLCGMMAAELGLDVKQARRAGLLHDIGKAMDHELEGPHAIIGANFIKKHGENDLIVNAVGAHHDEWKQESVIAHLVIAADALSGARPGARREILESYVKRLEDLEAISASFDGVDHSYAVQAGREIRVIVAHDRVNDDQASVLSRDIAKKIENELTYPGQVKVTVIREVRASEFAR